MQLVEAEVVFKEPIPGVDEDVTGLCSGAFILRPTLEEKRGIYVIG